MPCENFFMLENAFGDLQCLLCYKSFKGGYRCNIKRHFDSSHKNIQILDKKASQGLYEEKKLDFLEKFKGWLAKVENEEVVKQSNIKMKAELSSMISLYIAKQGRPFIDGVFVKNICLKIFQKMNLDTELVKNIPISRQTVARRIDELGIHIQSAVKEKINDCQFFSLCLDETTDINDLCQLAICVRTVNVNYEITETMFSLETFCGNVTGKILFDVVNEKVFSVFDANKFVGVCTDGANVMTGKNEGFIGQLNKNGISGRHFHCIIHQVALASKFLSGHPVMKRAEQIINEIRGGHHSLTHRKFVNFLKTTSARHNDLKMYTDIRWLSRGDCLNRLFELREEVLQFLEINCNEDTLVRSLKDDNFILDLAFLADVSFFLNKLNLKLQGKETGINDAVKNVHQFQTELFLLLRELQSGDYAHFPKTSLIITKHEGVKPSDHIAILEQLFNNFEDRFQDFVCFQPFLDIFENPFKCDISKYEFAIQSELIILQSENVPPHGDNIEFWKNLEESLYPILKRISYQCLSLFPTTYFCEKIFSDLKFICSKQRHSLTSSHLSNVLLLRSCHESIHIKDFIRDIIQIYKPKYI